MANYTFFHRSLRNGGIMQQKTVIITGISRGIGRAAALAFAKEGYAIAGCCHKNKELLQSLVQELDYLGTPHLLLAGDIADASFVNELFEQTVARFGGITLLINNAGISHIGLLQDMTDAQWQDLFSVNTEGVFRCCRAAIPGMVRKKSGCIVTVSSVWGEHGASCEAAYSASKAAVIGLTKALAKELGPSGIRVNCVAPGKLHRPRRHRHGYAPAAHGAGQGRTRGKHAARAARHAGGCGGGGGLPRLRSRGVHHRTNTRH